MRSNLSEIAGAGDRLSLTGLHETGDEQFEARRLPPKRQEIGLNLVCGFDALALSGRTGNRASLDRSGADCLSAFALQAAW